MADQLNRVYFRDTIHLTQPLLESLAASVNPGDRIILAARVLHVQGVLSLVHRELYVVADHFDGLCGEIWVTAPTPQELTVPAPLPEDGTNGMTVVVNCRTITGANIVSIGSNGQPGADGADGAEGADFMKPPPKFHPGTAGGNGENGWRGGDGGKGGLIIVNVVPDENGVPANVPLNLLSLPGAGGAGGKGGKGGAGGCANDACTQGLPNGEHWPDGDDGTDASAGTNGVSVEPMVILTASIEDYWREAKSVPALEPGQLFVPLEDDETDEEKDKKSSWAKHRLKMAEYFFRQYIPDTESAFYGPLARSEAEAVLAMAPAVGATAKHALLLRNFLENNISPMGMERDIEPRLSVPYYSDDYEFARERAEKVVDRELLFGMLAIQVDKIQSLAQGQFDELSNLATRTALQKSLDAAKEGLNAADLSEKEAKATVEQLSAMITNRANQLGEDESDLGLAVPIAAAALGVGFAFLVGGPPGAMAALPAAANYVVGSEEFKKFAGDLADELNLDLDTIEDGLATLQTVAELTGNEHAETLKNVKVSFKKFRADMETARGKTDPSCSTSCSSSRRRCISTSWPAYTRNRPVLRWRLPRRSSTRSISTSASGMVS